jgi:hypothetical protein
MDKFSPASNQSLPSSSVQLDPADTENLGDLETPADASTQEYVPIISTQELVSTPGALPHGLTSTSAPMPTSSARSLARVATSDLAPAPRSSVARGDCRF